MQKLYVYSRFEDQAPLNVDHAEIEPSVDAIREYYTKRSEKLGPCIPIQMTISFDEEFVVSEEIWDETDFEPALSDLIKATNQTKTNFKD